MKRISFEWVYYFVLISTTMLLCLPAHALETAPAPRGNPITVAKKVISDNFEKKDCPSIIKAKRIRDGSIRAVCSNGEAFRIFTVIELNKAIAMKCSAAEKLGVSGC